MSEKFDDYAAEYDNHCMRGLAVTGESKEYFARGRVEALRTWWSASGRAEPDEIVDLGCGVGDVTQVLAEAFSSSNIVGLDPSKGCIDAATSRYASDRLRFSRLTESSIAVGADLIHVNGVVHHVPVEKRTGFIEDLKSRLSPRGIAAIFENNPFNPGTRLVMSRIPFDQDAVPVSHRSLIRLLQKCGFSVLEVRFLFIFPHFLARLRFTESLFRRVPFGAQYLTISEG